MQKLKNTKKITLATVKSFAKRNSTKLYIKSNSSFDGMVDCVTSINSTFKLTEVTTEKGYFKTGIQGFYTVGSGGDYFTIYETEKFIGISVQNSCGSDTIAIKK